MSSKPTKTVMVNPSSSSPYEEINGFLAANDADGMALIGCIFMVPKTRKILVAVNHVDVRALVEESPMRSVVERRGFNLETAQPVIIRDAVVANPAVWLEYSNGDEITTDVLGMVKHALEGVGDLMLKSAFATTENVNNIPNLFKENPDA